MFYRENCAHYKGKHSSFCAVTLLLWCDVVGITEVCEALLPLLPVFVELVGCEDVGPATLAAQCAEALARSVLPSGAVVIPSSMDFPGH